MEGRTVGHTRDQPEGMFFPLRTSSLAQIYLIVRRGWQVWINRRSVTEVRE